MQKTLLSFFISFFLLLGLQACGLQEGSGSFDNGGIFSGSNLDTDNEVIDVNDDQNDDQVDEQNFQLSLEVSGLDMGLSPAAQIRVNGQSVNLNANGDIELIEALDSGESYQIELISAPNQHDCVLRLNGSNVNDIEGQGGDSADLKLVCLRKYNIGGGAKTTQVSLIGDADIIFNLIDDVDLTLSYTHPLTGSNVMESFSVSTGSSSYDSGFSAPIGAQVIVNIEDGGSHDTCAVENSNQTISSSNITNANLACVIFSD